MKAAKLSDPAEVVSANIKSDVFMPLCLNSVHNYCDDHVELSAKFTFQKYWDKRKHLLP